MLKIRVAMKPKTLDQSLPTQGLPSIESRIADALAKIILLGRLMLGRQATKNALSVMQSLVLEHLLQKGPTQVGQLASKLGVTKPTISDSLTALQRKGLISRKSTRQDARGVKVHLTSLGRKLARKQSHWIEIFETVVTQLGSQEKSLLLRLLLLIVAEFVERGLVQQARLCVTCKYFEPHAHPGEINPHHCHLMQAPLSDAHLRVDCPEHNAVAPEILRQHLRVLRGEC